MTVDMVIDSAIYGLWRFGMYAPDEPRIVDTMKAIRDQLSNNGAAGGIARYKDDYYFKVEPDTKKVPGNPWFICTLWLAQWYIATAKTAARPQAGARHHQLGGRAPAPGRPAVGAARSEHRRAALRIAADVVARRARSRPSTSSAASRSGCAVSATSTVPPTSQLEAPLQRDVAVLSRRSLDRLAQAELQAADELAARLARLDDVVDVAALGRHVRVGEPRRVLGDELLAPARGVRRRRPGLACR